MTLYGHIIGFLAHAIRVRQQGGISRITRALWDTSDVVNCEEKCDTLSARASEEARLCDSEIGEQWRTRLDARLQSLEEIHSLQTSLTKLHDKVDLAKLETARGATYDSSAEGDLPRCLQGTRTELLERIGNWATDTTGKHIFWLCGKAGTGKSTIARTIAQRLDEDGLLGASFFFKRGRDDRSHAKLLFPTIARQLADFFPEIGQAIAAVLEQDSLICDKHLRPQFDQLLLQPLRDVLQAKVSLANVVLVIDALDKCDNNQNIRVILLLLSKVEAITSLRLRIFVTSRPELPVELGFKSMTEDLHHDVRLEEAQEITIARDIGLFYEHQFSEIQRKNHLYHCEIPAEWPSEDDVRRLVERAIPLFIFAFTVSRYIAESNPQRRMDMILQQSLNKFLTGLKGTYLPILNQVVACEDNDERNDRIVDFQRLVGSIVLLKNPLSVSALCLLLSDHEEQVVGVLQPLDSVLNIPRAESGRIDLSAPITLLHLSFRDFLVEPELKKQNIFSIDASGRHSALGLRCLRLLASGGLKEDICEVNSLGTRRAEVAKSTVHTSLPEATAYACCYWVQHIVDSGEKVNDDGLVHEFLKKHLLHWMEALSWLGRASTIFHSLETLRAVVDVGSDLLLRAA